MLEITIGSRLISRVESLPFIYTVSAASLIIGWSGFSIHAQAISLISRTDLSPSLYMLSKLAHGILCCMTSFLMCKFFLAGKYMDVSITGPGLLPCYGFLQNLLYSTKAFLAVAGSMLAIPLLGILVSSVTGFYTKRS
jgi:hypothetical protein